MASKPHSGTSIFADTRCIAIILLNSSVLLVSDKTCLYPKVGRQVKSLVIPLQKNKAEAEKQRFEKIRFSEIPNGFAENFNQSEKMMLLKSLVMFYTVYLQGLASSSSVILMKGRVGFSTNDPKPIRNLLVRLAISLDREEPRSLIFFRSSTMDADRSIR